METENKTKVTLHIEFEENAIQLDNYNEIEDFEKLRDQILSKLKKAIEEKRLLINGIDIPNEKLIRLSALLQEPELVLLDYTARG